jgi:hypothetical protein
MMKTAVFSLALLVTHSGPVLADSCGEELAKIDSAISGATLAPDVKAQLQDMRNQAAELCSSGNAEEGLDVLSEATAILGGQ